MITVDLKLYLTWNIFCYRYLSIDPYGISICKSVWTALVSLSQTFRLTAEGLESMAAFIGQGLPMRPFDQHVKQPITIRFFQRHVLVRGNVATITDRCVKLSDVF